MPPPTVVDPVWIQQAARRRGRHCGESKWLCAGEISPANHLRPSMSHRRCVQRNGPEGLKAPGARNSARASWRALRPAHPPQDDVAPGPMETILAGSGSLVKPRQSFRLGVIIGGSMEDSDRSTVHIHAPAAAEVRRLRRRCSTCERRTTFVGALYHWYGWLLTCLSCGEQWEDGERLARPFQRAWRVANIQRANTSKSDGRLSHVQAT